MIFLAGVVVLVKLQHVHAVNLLAQEEKRLELDERRWKLRKATEKPPKRGTGRSVLRSRPMSEQGPLRPAKGTAEMQLGAVVLLLSFVLLFFGGLSEAGQLTLIERIYWFFGALFGLRTGLKGAAIIRAE